MSAFVLEATARFVYFSEKVERYLGWQARQFLDDMNFSFMKSKTPKRFLTYVAQVQKKYTDECLQPGFDYAAPQIMWFHSAMVNANNVEVPFIQCAVPVRYALNGMMHTVVGINFVDASHCADFVETGGIERLKAIKKIYVEACPEQFMHISPVQVDPITIYNPRPENFREPSEKEKAVLTLIAKGLSTKEIGERLQISNNTVETHRKHLLEKFETKNVAELIQKATKIYWLE